MVSSPSNLSIVVTPFIFKNAPFFTSAVISGTNSFLENIFTIMVSVKSVIANIIIVFSFRISLVSKLRICPRITTSPISPRISLISIVSSSKSLPYTTSGLSERLNPPPYPPEKPPFLNPPFCFSPFGASFFSSFFSGTGAASKSTESGEKGAASPISSLGTTSTSSGSSAL